MDSKPPSLNPRRYNSLVIDHTTLSPPPTTTTLPPPRKFPAPCWTPDETHALISTYRDKWYSLRRRNLRTSDWESVASELALRCPNSPIPKTSAQCRHKMEKLRKRYRTEKQRFLSLPLNPNHSHRLFSPSSWPFFHLMDSMESGSDPNTPPNPINPNPPNPNPPMAHINPNPNPNAVFALPIPPKTNPTPKPDLGKYFDEILTGGPIKIRVKNRSLNPSPNPNMNMNQGPPVGFKRVFPGEDYEERFEDEEEEKIGLKRKKEGRDAVGEMVASIKMLGEGLVRMEKMKMDMMREIERMRMDMEMKRSEMILESQQLIVNAFVEGMKKNKKAKLVDVE